MVSRATRYEPSPEAGVVFAPHNNTATRSPGVGR
jgi:hypothetical protein